MTGPDPQALDARFSGDSPEERFEASSSHGYGEYCDEVEHIAGVLADGRGQVRQDLTPRSLARELLVALTGDQRPAPGLVEAAEEAVADLRDIGVSRKISAFYAQQILNVADRIAAQLPPKETP